MVGSMFCLLRIRRQRRLGSSEWFVLTAGDEIVIVRKKTLGAALIRTIQQFFESRILPGKETASRDAAEHAHQLATAALLIEVSRADLTVKEEEREFVTETVAKRFGLSSEETAELVRLAEEEVRSAVSLYQFTRLIDKSFSLEEKRHLVELLWRLALVDHEKDKHEEHLIRRIADLLHVSHQDFIDAKIRAQRSSRDAG